MLEAVNLTKRYGECLALDQLNLHVQAGEVFCLLGANGAGKTTTINLFLNFIRPSAGEAMVDGMSVSANPIVARRHLGYVPEIVMLYPALTGLENLEYFSVLAGQSALRRPELEGLLGRAGLPTHVVHRRVGTYSKGMRQKVAVAIALAKGARALLLDEPTSGLDPQASNEFSALLNDLQTSGVAVLMATHDLFRAKETGTKLGIMKAGKLLEVLSAHDIGHADLEQLYLRHMHG